MNHQLTGLVDAAESLGILVLALALRAPRFGALLLLGLLGTSAKESFLPLSLAFVAGWHYPWGGLSDQARKKLPRSLAALCVGGILSLAAARLFVDGNVDSLAQILQSGGPALLSILAPVRAVTSPGFWNVYAWLLPLGILGLRALPRDWIRAVFAASILAFALILLRSPENAARVTFTVCGPLLSLAAARWLAGQPAHLPEDQTAK
ncbi:hypothetical protein EG835_04800 [bacterium]|nr:hypothetical protein [bacterium]